MSKPTLDPLDTWITEEAEQLLLQVKSAAAKSEQSRRYGPAACRADQLSAIEAFASRIVARVRQEDAQIARRMALNPWGAEHDGITPGHLAEQIAEAIQRKEKKT